VVFLAGSGPTDRDWLSPLLPGRNGSGRQLAERLAAKGIGSLRFDKVGSGTNMEHLDVLSLAHYVDEASLAFDFLAARPECDRVFLLGLGGVFADEAACHHARDAGIVASHGDDEWSTWQLTRCFTEERVRSGPPVLPAE
jgi:hypothetical protein